MYISFKKIYSNPFIESFKKRLPVLPFFDNYRLPCSPFNRVFSLNKKNSKPQLYFNNFIKFKLKRNYELLLNTKIYLCISITGSITMIELSLIVINNTKQVDILLYLIGRSITIILLGFCMHFPTYRNFIHDYYRFQLMQSISLFPITIYLGCFGATISTALVALISVPKLLQRMGQDDVYPLLKYLAKGYGRTGEPYRAHLLAMFVSSTILCYFGQGTVFNNNNIDLMYII